MQGRLLPKYKGRYQAHPVGTWQQEFMIARSCGLDLIEFIFDYEDADKNPLLYEGGTDEILSLVNFSNVNNKTICADYFMEAPLHSENDEISYKSLCMLKKIMISAKLIGVSDIVIPCVDQSALKTSRDIDVFISTVNKIVADLDELNLNLSLETDLPPIEFLNIINSFDSKNITINYDIGNSASLGYDPVEELTLYGDKITDIHIKDRVIGGDSVLLGEGDAMFNIVFSELRKIGYKGPLIMQAYRDDQGIDVFKKQLQWVKKYINTST